MCALSWIQVYDPLASPWLSTAAAALPIVLLLAALALLEWRAHHAALLGLVSALGVSVFVFTMNAAGTHRSSNLSQRSRRRRSF